MKWTIALLLLAGASPALACPPPPPGYHRPSPEEALRGRVMGAPNIVYAVVESAIQGEGTDLNRTAPGHIRVMHAYKGGLRMGQRIPMYGLTARTDCGNIDYSREHAREGAYGILLMQNWNGHDPVPFVSFESQATVDEMLRLGLIVSARGGR
jgi:hypothetical protein